MYAATEMKTAQELLDRFTAGRENKVAIKP